MDTRQFISLFIFILSYILFVFLTNRRTLVAVVGSLLLVLTGAVSLGDALVSINWNVMGIFVGTLMMADVFVNSRVPAYLAEIIVRHSKNTAWAILFICLLTGFISAFVENVATVLIIAPVAISISRKIGFNPIKMMIAIAVSSNLQGAATLIGDSPSMLLAGFAKMNFWDFFFYKGKPGIFFAVEIGALVSFVVLYLIFRKNREKIYLPVTEVVKSWIPTVLLALLIIFLAISSFVDIKFSYTAGVICMVFGIVSLLWEKFVNKSSIIKNIRLLNWDTSIFLVGIFVLVGALTLNGWTDKIAVILSGLVGKNIFLGYFLIVFLSVLFSCFIDNIPFLAAMIPVAIKISATLNIDPSLYLFGLLIGASLGGNITPIGASANIVCCGILKKAGYTVKFGDFVKIGLPFTLTAVSAAFLFGWMVWR
ncbi:MAG: SLC13 family permease [Elusimicrobiota bacterium]